MKIYRACVFELEDLPNVGKALAAYLRSIDVRKPDELAGKNPFAMYQQLSKVMGVRHDRCMLDVLICAVRFVEGGPPLLWWAFMAERRRMMPPRITRKKSHEPR